MSFLQEKTLFVSIKFTLVGEKRPNPVGTVFKVLITDWLLLTTFHLHVVTLKSKSNFAQLYFCYLGAGGNIRTNPSRLSLKLQTLAKLNAKDSIFVHTIASQWTLDTGHWTVLDRMSSRFLTGFPQDFVQISLRFLCQTVPSVMVLPKAKSLCSRHQRGPLPRRLTSNKTLSVFGFGPS